MRFRDRTEAGERLADALARLSLQRPVVFGVPRGGVVVAAAVARRLGAPLVPIVVRKVGSPFNPELAVGAVGPGLTYINRALCAELGVSERQLAAALEQARLELAERMRRLGASPQLPELRGRSAVLVDDGVATGATAELAVRLLRQRHPDEVVLAVPVAAAEALRRLEPQVDRCVCLHVPEPFFAVGAHYERFGQVSDAEVAELLRAVAAAAGTAAPDNASPARED